MNSEAKVQMTDGWGCSMLMNAAILNLTKIRKQYVSNMQARRAQEHMNFLVFRNLSIFNLQSIPARRSSGFEMGLAKSGDELADLRVEQTALCKRLTTSGKCSNNSASNHHIHAPGVGQPSPNAKTVPRLHPYNHLPPLFFSTI